MSIKNPLTPAGIEPATLWFVPQHHDHSATAVPLWTALPCFYLAVFYFTWLSKLKFFKTAHCTKKLAYKICKKRTYYFSRCPALVCKFPVSTEYGSREQLEVLYGVRTREVQDLFQCVDQVKEQAVQEQDQLHRQLVLVNAEKEHALLQNTHSMKNLSK